MVESASAITNGISQLTSGSDNNVLTTTEFMKLLITELTNQDPMDPMKNQDLLDQMATIQNLESSQSMTRSFSGLTDRFDGFINQFDEILVREQMSTASKMIGQLVSGTDIEGEPAFGEIVSIKVEGNATLLKLDSDQVVNMDNLDGIGGELDKVTASDMVGKFIMGLHNGKMVIGEVQSVIVDGDDVSLSTDLNGGSWGSQPEAIKLSDAVVMNEKTIEMLIGKQISDGSKTGVVSGYTINGNKASDISLTLSDGSEISLTDITNIENEAI